MDAWHASGYEMLVTDDPVGGADHAAAVAAVTDTEHPLDFVHDAATIAGDIGNVIHDKGFILLPVALAIWWTM